MEAALQRRVQRYGWDKASAYYENTWLQQLKPAHDALFALAKIEAGEKIIDVASYFHNRMRLYPNHSAAHAFAMLLPLV